MTASNNVSIDKIAGVAGLERPLLARKGGRNIDEPLEQGILFGPRTLLCGGMFKDMSKAVAPDGDIF